MEGILMKKNIFRSVMITGALCTVLVMPAFAQKTEVSPIAAGSTEIVPIGYESDHWAKAHVDQIAQKYGLESIFKDKDLNSAITVKDFQNLVKSTINEAYDRIPEAVTREAIIHEFVEIWAEKTGKVLDEIPVIKMLIYPDTDKIHAKYNHGITVAYMKNIAKGRDTGIFDPKAQLTYGELAVLIVNTDKAIEKEVGSGEAIVAGKFETKGSYEIKEEKVVFDFEFMSHYTEEKEIQFNSGQQFEIIITDDQGKEVYRFSQGKGFTSALVYKSIIPGESLKWQDEWDMTDKEGEKLETGKYQARIKVLAFEDGGKTIEEEQLTTVIDFSL